MQGRMANVNGQPVMILPEGAMRDQGKSAQNKNIGAAIAVGETVRTTLGPKGMDKMLVEPNGNIVITNDGITILEKMDVQHPAGKMMVDISRTQEQQVGDGTTTAVVLGAELLKEAKDLLDDGIHPSVIIKGYRLASQEAMNTLEDIAESASTDDYLDVVRTTITGKTAESYSDLLSEVASQAINHANRDDIRFIKSVGGAVDDTKLIEGVVLDKEIAHPKMPKVKEEAKILLLNDGFYMKEAAYDTEVNVTTPEQLDAFMKAEQKALKEMVNKVKELDVDVVFCQKAIDDVAQHYLKKHGIMALRNVKRSQLEALSNSTGAELMNGVDDVVEEDLGYAGKVREESAGGDKFVHVENCVNPKTVTIVVHGGTKHVADEIERALEDAIGVLSVIKEGGKVVVGAGAVEAELALKVRDYADTVNGREQLAIHAYADALESIPKTLAENSGLDTVDVLVDLRSAHSNGKPSHGVNVSTGKIEDMSHVVEPLKIKTQALQSATESAEMVLRIDDVITANQDE